MTQPEYVPAATNDRVRSAERLPAPDGWMADRPAEIPGVPPIGRRLGSVGPDQGYGLKLALRFADRLFLAPGENVEDAIAGCTTAGLRRAALFGRAPVIYDLELAYVVWGYLARAPDDLVQFRLGLFQSAAHDYWRQREIADRVRESALRLAPAAAAEQVLADWKSLLVADA